MALHPGHIQYSPWFVAYVVSCFSINFWKVQNTKISAVRSLADICFLHVLIWLISNARIILFVCVSAFLVLSILHTVILVSSSFVFDLQVCERLTTDSLDFSAYQKNCFFYFLAIKVRFLLTSVSSFQGPILAVAGYNRWRKGFICQSSDECHLNYSLVFPKNFSWGYLFRSYLGSLLSPPLGFVSPA